MPARKPADTLSLYAELVVDHATDCIVITDTSGRFEWVNKAFWSLTGYTLDEVMGKTPGQVLQGPDTDPAIVSKISEAVRTRSPIRTEIYNYNKSGDGYWIELSITPIFDASGKHTHFMAVQRDITRRRALEAEADDMRAAEELRKAERRLLNDTAEWLYSAKSLDELLAVVRRSVEVLMPETTGSLYIYANSRDTLDRAVSWGEEAGYEHFTPDECWALRRGRPYFYGQGTLEFCCSHVDNPDAHYFCLPIVAHGDTIGLFHVLLDDANPVGAGDLLTQRWDVAIALSEQISLAIANVRLREELREQSVRDALTGLWNRRWFLETANRTLARAIRTGSDFALLSLDIDHFKNFNDHYGHDIGDLVLREVGALMYEVFTGDMSPCRVGGEEFVVICDNLSRDDIMFVAEQFRESLREIKLSGQGVTLPPITVSQGLAMSGESLTSALDVLKAADNALYAAKAAGRDCIRDAAKLNAEEAHLSPSKKRPA